ncbi:MAG TPA: CPCC family cysteine-rich protein [Thermoanaerobaculia bacterium]|nr:CPCC family cysteine-rich protein [Thermoanaerobaculia bacterium]
MSEPRGAPHPCAACGFAVHEGGAGSGRTCPVCGWIDDAVQLAQPDLAAGANVGLCLRGAQRRALSRFPRDARRHGEWERDPRWRPLAAGEGPRTAAFSPSSPVCYLEDSEVEDAEPYWFDPPPDAS